MRKDMSTEIGLHGKWQEAREQARKRKERGKTLAIIAANIVIIAVMLLMNVMIEDLSKHIMDGLLQRMDKKYMKNFDHEYQEGLYDSEITSEMRAQVREAVKEAAVLAREEGYAPGDPEWKQVYSRILKEILEEKGLIEDYNDEFRSIQEDNE